ncbi:GNAT family N-acetyltransferase [Kitasatospora sp. NPDC002227]|uniref:GNAT family N-acetyltransferase n=1 Tax=Kitasatospora sp. NPDC002227 TaxID=3154773 RepID=UPI00332F119A
MLALPQLLRPARPEEAGELSALALRSKAHRGYDETFLAACREELTLRPEDTSRTVVAEQDGRVVGFVTLAGEPPVGELAMLFVDPPAIGRGIGSLLHARATATATLEGFTRLTVTADPHAEAFYLARGARRTGSEPSGSIPGRELPLLTIDL